MMSWPRLAWESSEANSTYAESSASNQSEATGVGVLARMEKVPVVTSRMFYQYGLK